MVYLVLIAVLLIVLYAVYPRNPTRFNDGTFKEMVAHKRQHKDDERRT